MTKINCAEIRCEFRNEKGTCTKKNINLSSWGVHTKHMGYKDFWECKSFEFDEHYLELEKKMEELGIIPKEETNGSNN